MSEWSVKVDLGETQPILSGLIAGLTNRTKLHSLFVIACQGYVFRNWPKGSPLSGITIASRRKNSTDVLQDSGRGRLSITGSNPGAISKAPGTLNAAMPEHGVVGTNLPYMAIHQTGGTIHARSAKNLAIPLTRRARAAGSPRNFGKELVFVPSRRPGVTGLLVEKGKQKPFTLHFVAKKEINRNGKTIRVKDSGSWFWIPVSKAAESAGGPSGLGKKLLFIESKKHEETLLVVEVIERKRTQAQFLLRKSVTIPARPFLPTEAQIVPSLIAVANWYLQSLADGVKGGSPPQAA